MDNIFYLRRNLPMMRRLLIILSVTVLVFGIFSSCELIVERDLEGSWIMDTTMTAGFAVGDGTLSLTFFDENSGIEAYLGSGNLGGINYSVTALYDPDFGVGNMLLFFDGTIDPDDDIMFEGTYSSGAASGDYTGSGNYFGDDGTFVMN